MVTRRQRTVVFDVETDGLLKDATVVHCISAYCIETGISNHWGPGEIEDGLKALGQATTLVGHNICGYDFPVLRKLHGWQPRNVDNLVDTFLVDCLLYPEMLHSLEKVADRLHLKQRKVQHEDWSTYSEEMRVRCDSDVVINTEIYKHYLGLDGYKDIKKALDIEQEVSFIHAHQALYGVTLDIDRGIKLYNQLKSELGELESKILKDLPLTTTIVGVAKKNQEEVRKQGVAGQASHTKAGSLTQVNKNYFSRGDEELAGLEARVAGSYSEQQKITLQGLINKRERELCAQGPFTKISFDRLNLNSPTQVSSFLMDLGWKPTEYNNKKLPDGSWVRTGPKLTEDSYHTLPPGLGQDIARYNILKHRKSILLTIRKKDGEATGLLALAQKRGDKRVGADGHTCGTNTGRYRHFGVVNIPRPSTLYGTEIRELFTVPEDSWLIGIDLSGIEAVVLAHYCMRYEGGDALAEEILKGDFHQANADMWGVDRNTAKSILYALCYGAGGPKLAAIANNGRDGLAMKAAFFSKYPAVKALVDDLEKSYDRHGTYIKTLDGRRVFIRSKHKLLNTLIQSAAAIIFKMWMLEVHVTLSHNAKQVIAMHDELQIEWQGGKAGALLLGDKVCSLAEKIGEELGIKVPVTAEAKVGKNWADTH